MDCPISPEMTIGGPKCLMRIIRSPIHARAELFRGFFERPKPPSGVPFATMTWFDQYPLDPEL